MIELNMAKFNVKNPQTGEFEPLDGATQAKIQSDWNQTDNTEEDYIKNKPTLGTAAGKGVDTSPVFDSENLVTSGGVYSAIAKKPGEITTGKQYTIDGETVTADTGAEAFNDLSNNKPTGECSHAEGSGTTASGACSHAEGDSTTAYNWCSHAEGYETTASGEDSHAEGRSTIASGDYSHAEGDDTTASSDCSHAEGDGTIASGMRSHAEGGGTTASGMASHAEGFDTTASGDCSHSQGCGTKASSENQHVQGKYNVEDANDTYAFIIGNGTGNNARHNAFAIDWNGNVFTGSNTTSEQSHIARAIDRVAKNLLYVEPGITQTDKGITFTTNSDGTISYSGTASATGYATYTIVTRTNPDGNLFKDCMLYSGVSGTLINEQFVAIEGTTSPYTRYALSSNQVAAIDSIPTGIEIHVYVRVNCISGTAYNGTFKPMICTMSDWEASSEVVPYALPSTTLTPVLIKQVNEGAKNKFDIFNATEEKSETVTRTINADGTVTVSNSGSNTGPAILYYRTYLTADVPYVISGCPVDGSVDGYSLAVRKTDASPITDAIDYGSGSNTFTVSTSGTYLVYLRIGAGYAFSNKIFKPMICTAEDWAVSRKFVPYAPTNQELISTKANNLKKTLVASGSLNDISTNEFAIYTSAVTGKPQSGYAFVRTSAFDANAAMQELTMLDGTYSGRSYVRVKNGGTWTSWREITNS